MKILFLTDNFPPEVNAPATRTYEHCKEWVNRGATVTVITCAPNFPQGKVFKGYKNKLYQKEIIDGIIVIRVWTFITANKGTIRRTLDFLSFAFMSFFFGLSPKADIIIGTSPQFFTALASRWLGFFKRTPWVMEVRDLWPESIAAVGAIQETNWLYLFLQRLEKRLYASANLIVVVTDTFKKKIQDMGVSSHKIVVVKNGVDTSVFTTREKNKRLIEELSLNGHFVVGYIGTHGMSHALDFILECASQSEKAIHYILQGDGAEKKNLMRKAQSLELTNVTFLPFVPKSEIADYISIIDVALVNLKSSPTFKTVIPSKIFENASMQKPILLGVAGESKDIIDHYQAGVSFIPEDQHSFFGALKEIRNPERYSELQQGCSRLAEDFERKNLAEKMYMYLGKLNSKS